jgi:chitodextrinase
VPTGFTIAGRTATSITIDWADSTDAVGTTGYEVFRGGVSIATPTSSVYTDTGRAYDTSYSYTVRARDAAGNWSAQSSAFVARTIGNERRYDGAGIPDNTVIVPNVTAGTGDTPFQEVNTGGAPYWDADLGEMVFGSASTPIHYVRWKDFNFTGPWSIQAYYTWTGSATSTGVHFLYAMDAAGGREWSLTTASGGALIARDTLSNIIGTASPAQVPGTRYRIAVFGVAGAPDIHVRMYEYGSGTPIWTSDISNIGTSSAPGIIEFGRHGTTAMGTVYRVAHFATEALAGIIDPIETTPEVELFLWTEARTLSIPIELLGVLT